MVRVFLRVLLQGDANRSWSGQTGAGVTRGFRVGIAAPKGLMGLHEEVEGPR